MANCSDTPSSSCEQTRLGWDVQAEAMAGSGDQSCSKQRHASGAQLANPLPSQNEGCLGGATLLTSRCIVPLSKTPSSIKPLANDDVDDYPAKAEIALNFKVNGQDGDAAQCCVEPPTSDDANHDRPSASPSSSTSSQLNENAIQMTFGFPGSGVLVPQQACTYLVPIIICLGSCMPLFAVVWAALHSPCARNGIEEWKLYVAMLLRFVFTATIGVAAVRLWICACTSHLRQVAYYLLAVWLGLACLSIFPLDGNSCHNGGSLLHRGFHSGLGPGSVLFWFGWTCTVLTNLFSVCMIQGHVAALESTFFSNLGARSMMLTIKWISVLLVPAAAVEIFVLPAHFKWVLPYTFALALSLFAARAIFAFLEVNRFAKQATGPTTQPTWATAKEAVATLRSQAIGVTLMILPTIFLYCPGFRDPAAYFEVSTANVIFYDVLQSFAALGTACGSLLMSGALSGAISGGAVIQQSEALRMKKRRAVTQKYKPSSDPAWQAKVEELAGRGITLAVLLEFYEGLGKNYMLHFDPQRHTTNDVVRQAIIPLSSQKKSDYASIMMDGAPQRPGKTVTHSWRGLFRDLVAATVADALGEMEFELLASLIDSDLQLVKDCLVKRGTISSTYWLCIFAVSQHDNICGGNPCCEKDSVTNLPLPLCCCGKKKVWHSTPPLRSDGKSINCELNKFGDMLSHLSATDESFSQVIAVDRSFGLFDRVCCTAEIVQAFQGGIQQELKVPSAKSLNGHADHLRSLRAQDMKASQKSAVDDILTNISDLCAFNQQLQVMISEVLVARWNTLYAAQQLENAGRVARWQKLKHSMYL